MSLLSRYASSDKDNFHPGCYCNIVLKITEATEEMQYCFIQAHLLPVSQMLKKRDDIMCRMITSL